jgi:hypothetical protein
MIEQTPEGVASTAIVKGGTSTLAFRERPVNDEPCGYPHQPAKAPYQ